MSLRKNHANLNDSSKISYSERKCVPAWLAQLLPQIFELCIQSIFAHTGVVKSLNTPPKTSYPNTPYLFISDRESDFRNGVNLVNHN